jgi:hypothetical protein
MLTEGDVGQGEIFLSPPHTHTTFHFLETRKREAMLICTNRKLLVSNLRPFVRFEVLTALLMNNTVFWDVTPYNCYNNRRFGGAYRFRH